MKYKYIAIKFSTFQRFKRLLPPMENEKMVAYFERLSKKCKEVKDD